MTHARSIAAGLVAIASVLIGPRRLAAQQVRGAVSDSASSVPIPGAVVTTLDSLGRAGRRSITDERGSFFVTAPAATRRLRIVRLGFRPVDVDLSVARDSTAQVNVAMVRIPYHLQPIRVAAGASCPRRADRTAALALLEQARAGLLATVIARSERPARMKRLMVERRMEGTSDRIVRHRVRIDSGGLSRASFGAALKASEFVRDGFTLEDADGRTFFAPDAEVLLDDAFSAGYCFHIMDRDRTRPNQVGLGFRPGNRQRDRIDVDGALWVDTVARALVDIRFRYVGLGPAMEAHEPGGRIGFREMANGVVLIDSWLLRLTGAESDTASGGRRALVSSGHEADINRRSTTRLVLADAGGELASATWPDGYTWRAALGTLVLTVTNERRVQMPNVRVRLADTDYAATTDSTGSLRITDLAPGPYSAVVVDPRLDSIGVTLRTTLSFVAARNSITQRTVRATTAEDFVAERCRKDRRAGSGTAWLIGRITNANGSPLEGVTWTLRAAHEGRETEFVRGAETGSDGLFAFCGLSRLATASISFQRRGMQAGTATRVLREHLNVMAVEMTGEAPRR